jgi:hypothetical protein
VQVYNPATGQTADVVAKSFGMWAQRGWLPVDPSPENEDAAEGTEPEAEKTAASGRGQHPTAKANKDK